MKTMQAWACGAALVGAASLAAATNEAEVVALEQKEPEYVTAEFAMAFDSKYLSYGLVDNRDPILTPSASVKFLDGLTFSVEALFDVTKYGRKAGYTSREWQYTELHPGVWLGHDFSPDEIEGLPTTLHLSTDYQYEYHPNSKYQGTPEPDGQGDDTQFWCAEIGLPDLWFEPLLVYERDVIRDNGTYVHGEVGHCFPLIDAAKEGDDSELVFRLSLVQGWGNTQRVRSYLHRSDGAPLDRGGFMDTCLKGELTWQLCDHLALSGYVAYYDYLFDRPMREAARNYEATGRDDTSYQFVGGLALTASF